LVIKNSSNNAKIIAGIDAKNIVFEQFDGTQCAMVFDGLSGATISTNLDGSAPGFGYRQATAAVIIDGADEAVTLTGLQMTGTLDTDLGFTIFPGWGTLDWGENGWGSVDAGNETLPSFPITMSLGTLVAETKQEVVLSGFEITGSLADLNPFFDNNLVLPNSLLATGSLGTLGVNAGDDVQIGLTAFSMTGSIGALAPQDNINPLLSSFEITGRVGNLIEATTVIVPITTSLLATGSVGAITPSNNTGVTITDSLLATGTLNASDVTTPDIVLGLTGFEITANIGTQFGILHYGNVDLGSNTSYTDVDTTKAA
jgi:hypothetical protein